MDVFEYLVLLDQERYRAVIIHAAPDKGPALTDFCNKICKSLGGKYLDLLELFIQTPDLSQKIDSFGPENLRKLLIEHSKAQSLLIVDRADFLLDTWRKSERGDFYRLLENQWDGFKEGMGTKLVVSLQTSQEILLLQIKKSTGQSRILHLSDFNDI